METTHSFIAPIYSTIQIDNEPLAAWIKAAKAAPNAINAFFLKALPMIIYYRILCSVRPTFRAARPLFSLPCGLLAIDPAFAA